MNKQNLWFFTLFSLILILGAYYITMPNSLLEKVAEETDKIKTSKQKVINEVKFYHSKQFDEINTKRV